MAYTYTPGTSIHVTIHLQPFQMDSFFTAFETFYHNIIREEECLSFQMYRNLEKPETIVWVEEWSKSPEWLVNNIITKDYYQEYLDVTEPMLLFGREANFFERPPMEYSFSRAEFENYRGWVCAN
ncbi:hypothetical protein F4679DRAFT_587820 [Xylaria curta]|nr:hypothetical protein F4679DRAFT_587820 [Xylaria curta]